MLRSFFISAVRHLIKNRSYAILNILGLSIGLACFTLIALWVKDELGYDRFHKNAGRIFRVGATFTDESGQFDQAVTCVPLAPAMKNDLPEVEDVLRIDINDAIVRVGDKQFVEDDILGVDPSFFNIFSFKLLRGDAATALREPYSVILTESMATKYFGQKDPLGESLLIYLFDPNGSGAPYKVTGIVEDAPRNAHFSYNFLFSFSTLSAVRPQLFTNEGWFDNSYYTYVLTRPGADARQLEAKFPAFLEKYMGLRTKQYKFHYAYFLQALTDIHLRSRLRYELSPTGSMSYVLIFGTTGLIVLLLACINYINLSTAYAADRFKEVGVRKVMGAFRAQLIAQHLIESWLLAVASLLVAIAWMELARPLFEDLTGKVITTLYTASTMGALLAIASGVGLLSGLYPSLALSSFRTVNILKGQFRTGTTGVWLRKSLVVVQYAITIVLITGILVVQLQLHFMHEKDLGFDKDNLLVLKTNGDIQVVSGFEAFAAGLQASPLVTGMARSNSMIAGGLGNAVAVSEDAAGKKVNATVYSVRVDHHYLDVYGMKLVAGRNFIEGNAADSAMGFIVNEATTRTYGYDDPNQAIGKYFSYRGREGRIIGVVRDFHYSSLQQKIEPTCLYLLNGSFSRIAVRLNGSMDTNLALVMRAWKKYFPNSVPDYEFAEDSLEDQYRAEQRFSAIFLVFSAVSLSIACLGLFALVSYSVESRTKEIGIRKVLGASVPSIVNMLSKEFLTLIIVACFIAVPVAYYFMQQWLQDFAYRIDLGAEVFMTAGIVALLVAMATVSIRSITSAMANPVDALRNE
ncbi:ABC transporter permease [Fulvivirgaceae bacterium PWU4]|uniref:ABC transporter permease n=1 Tax=Chryseosolibacter histidini TaxID=2782349 RepID=A0AAP2DQL4_9BACT|nr:ABC transporter permease [Chryseosolibacter histidini]MBT1699754.1 ABC transporter permease [Chryseosolibacter histidini]